MNGIKEKDRVTKEIALFLTPLFAAYLFIAFYESGFSSFYGIPHDLISVNVTNVILTHRFTLVVAGIAFLWVGLYYNLLPSTNSPLFKGLITLIVILALWLGFNFGQSDARKKTEFLVLNTDPEQVVLKIYNNNIISAPFDRKHKTLAKQFTITKVGKTAHLTMTLEQLGPLEIMLNPAD